MSFMIGITILSFMLAFITYQLAYGGGERKNGRTQIGGYYL